MVSDQLSAFEEVWAVDSEFRGDSGNPYEVVCVAGVELRTGRRLALWYSELGAVPPFRVDAKSLIVVFVGTAEAGAFLALRWPLPERLLDLSPEYRLKVNGLASAGDKRSLLDALKRHDLPGMAAGEKDFWRDGVLRGPPYSEEERTGILNYCLADADSTAELLLQMDDRLAARPPAVRIRQGHRAGGVSWHPSRYRCF
jgi:hypothetical protein